MQNPYPNIPEEYHLFQPTGTNIVGIEINGIKAVVR
jgi:hypothetical protein